MYNKLFTKILDSSIWLESTPTRIVWLTFLAVMDETGFAQFAAVKNVAHRARVSPEEAEEAIRVLESPDPDSSNPKNEGRRLERVPGGWMVLNSEDHRKLVTKAVIQEQTKERVRRHREKKRNALETLGNDQPLNVTPSETRAIARSEKEKNKSSAAASPHSNGNGNGHAKNLKVITKIAHTVIDAEPHAGFADWKEAAREQCARAHIRYDAEVVGTALESALAQRGVK